MKQPLMHLRATVPMRFGGDEWRRVEPHETFFRLHITPEFALDFGNLESIEEVYYPTMHLNPVDEFKEEITAQISPERIKRACLPTSDSSVFFNSAKVDEMMNLFREKKYISGEIHVVYLGERVTPQELPDNYHDIYLEYTVEYEMEYCVPLSANRDIFETIHAGYAIKEKKGLPLSKEQLYTVPLRKKHIQKGASVAAIGIAITTLLVVFGNHVTKAPDWRLKAVGALIVGVGSLAGIFFRQQAAVVAEHAYSNPLLTEKGEIFYE